MIETQTSENLVYSTPNTSLYQCDSSEKFTIKLFNQEITFTVCSLIAFKKKLKDVDLAGMFDPSHPGIEIMNLAHCDRFFVFTIREILELRDLLAGSFAMLELNSLIHRAILRK